MSRSGGRISGTVEKLVVVKTDPASPGTGEIVGTICG
jgi:hypothetical protein